MFGHARDHVVSLAVAAICIVCGTAGTASAQMERSGEGFLTSAQELAALRRDVASEAAPPLQRYHVRKLIDRADDPWLFGNVGTRFGTIRTRTSGGRYDKHCAPLNDTSKKGILTRIGPVLYAKALAYHLSGDASHAKEVRNRLMDLTESSGFDRVDGKVDYTGANQCAYEIGQLIPLLIESAILLETYSGWHEYHKRRVQRWLADVPYAVIAAIADTRKNNWGTAAAFAGWAVGHYLGDTQLSLTQRYPVRRVRTPQETERAHLASQLRIVGTEWAGDSRCRRYGFMWHGGFPDELRRGSTGCEGEYLRATDSSYRYQLKTVTHLVYHAEALRRHGADELYRYTLYTGEPLLLRAIRFVIDNTRGPSHDWRWYELGVLRAASHAYEHPSICEQLARSRGVHIKEGGYLPFFRVTRGDRC